MKESIRQKLENLSERHEEVGMMLGDPDIILIRTSFVNSPWSIHNWSR